MPGDLKERSLILLDINLSTAGVAVSLPGLIILGLVIGFMSGMFGAGGGFLLTPFLRIFFGVPYPLAIGSSLLQIFFTCLAAAGRHWKQRTVDPLLACIMAAGALAGTEIGVRVLNFLATGNKVIINGRSFLIQDLFLTGMFLFLMTGVAVFIGRETSRAQTNAGDETATTIALGLQTWKITPVLAFPRSRIRSLSLWIPLALSLFVGILTGLMGVGGGFVNFPLLVYVIGVPTHVAVGTSALQVALASGYGALRHAGQGNIDLLLVALLLIGSLAGARLGAVVSRRFAGTRLRRYFAGVLLVGVLVILGDLVAGIWW